MNLDTDDIVARQLLGRVLEKLGLDPWILIVGPNNFQHAGYIPTSRGTANIYYYGDGYFNIDIYLSGDHILEDYKEYPTYRAASASLKRQVKRHGLAI